MKLRLLALVILLAGGGAAWAQANVRVEVFKSPYCGCCGKWVDHLRQNGFEVTTRDVENVPSIRKKLGMPDRLGSCHTAKVDGYVIEGHVPAADIRRLLKERPRLLGLAVPAMVPGSPGMESPTPVPYDTLAVQSNGSTRVFARHEPGVVK